MFELYAFFQNKELKRDTHEKDCKNHDFCEVFMCDQKKYWNFLMDLNQLNIYLWLCKVWKLLEKPDGCENNNLQKPFYTDVKNLKPCGFAMSIKYVSGETVIIPVMIVSISFVKYWKKTLKKMTKLKQKEVKPLSHN